MADPLVSILIITYNQERFIREAITSALDQNYDNLQVIVADDYSTDGTKEIILELATQYPKRLIPVLGECNTGITGNSNKGLARCNGKYIALQGGDDVLIQGKIRKQVEWMEVDENRVLCGHDCLTINEQGEPKYMFSARVPLRKGQGPAELIRYGPIFAATTVLMRGDCFPEYGFDSRVSIVSDWKVQIDCLRNGGEYGFIEGVYAKYRQHSKGVTQIRKKAVYEDSMVCLQIVKQEYIGYTNEIKRRECELRLVLEWMELKARTNMQLVRNCIKYFHYCGLSHLFFVLARLVRLMLIQAGLLGTPNKN